MRSATTTGYTSGAARSSGGMPMACCGAVATPGRMARWWAGSLLGQMQRWPQLAGRCSVTGGGALAAMVAASARSATGRLLEIGASGLHQGLRTHPKLLIEMYCWMSACMIAGMESMHGAYMMVPRHRYAGSSQALALQQIGGMPHVLGQSKSVLAVKWKPTLCSMNMFMGRVPQRCTWTSFQWCRHQCLPQFYHRRK
jgi:hypothetical protein